MDDISKRIVTKEIRHVDKTRVKKKIYKDSSMRM